ncbi:MAG: YncE family protein [candidate division WOR-3 bacterium]|nr:MAG: YncE family protein [candidate division WOR-3 bacterium]
MKKMLAIAALGAVSICPGQYLEKTIYMPDSVGGALDPQCIAYSSQSDVAYVGGGKDQAGAIVAIDGSSGRKVASIPLARVVQAACYDSHDDRVYFARSGDGGAVVTAIDCESNQIIATLDVGTNPVRLLYNPASNKVYSAGYRADSVTVIDATANEVVATVPVGGRPRDLVYVSRYNTIFCACESRDSVYVIDGTTDELLASICVGEHPWALDYDSRLDRVFCLTYGGGELAAIDPLHNEVVGSVFVSRSELVSLVAGSRNGQVYVYDGARRSVMVFDGDSLTLVDSIEVGQGGDVLLHDSVGNRVFCSGSSSGNDLLFAIDCSTNRVVASIDIGERPVAACISLAHRMVYTVDNRDYTVSVVDAEEMVLVGAIRVGDWPTMLCYNPTGDKVYCANQKSCTVTAIDGQSGSVLGIAPVGLGPSALSYSTAQNKLYCANYGDAPYRPDSTVTVIDGNTHAVLRTLNVGRGPGSLAYVPLRDRVYCSVNGGYNRSDSVIRVIDCATDEIVKSIRVPRPPGILFHNPAHNKLYVTIHPSSELTVIDCGCDSVIAHIAVRGPSYDRLYLDYNEVNGLVYCTGGDRLEIIDTTADTVVAEVDLGYSATGICVGPTGKVYVGWHDGSDGKVLVFDPVTHSQVAEMPVPPGPYLLSCDREQNRIYCAADGSTMLSVIDGASDQVAGSVTVGHNPMDVLSGAIPGHVYVTSFWAGAVRVVNDATAVEEDLRHPVPGSVGSVLVHHVLSPNGSEQSDLLDITGRKVMELSPGPNDIRHLAPGVYFVVTPSPLPSPPEGERRKERGLRSADSGTRSAIRKVIIQH